MQTIPVPLCCSVAFSTNGRESQSHGSPVPVAGLVKRPRGVPFCSATKTHYKWVKAGSIVAIRAPGLFLTRLL
jgi:hypothetical protein